MIDRKCSWFLCVGQTIPDREIDLPSEVSTRNKMVLNSGNQKQHDPVVRF